MNFQIICLILFISGSQLPTILHAICDVPSQYQVQFFSIENGLNTYTKIDEASQLTSPRGNLRGKCDYIPSKDAKLKNSQENIAIVFKNETNNCYFCYYILLRSNFVYQYSRSQCSTIQNNNLAKKDLCEQLVFREFITGFQLAKERQGLFNCKSVLEGVFQFSYRIVTQTGVCNSPNSILTACQRQGSPLKDNSIFTTTFGWCPAVASSIPDDPLFEVEKYRWTCLGRWVDDADNIWAAIQYDGGDEKFKYRCMTTRIDQQNEELKDMWGLTVDADCLNMKNYFDAPIRLELFPTFDAETQVVEMEPGCKLPVNFTGHWFYPGEYNTKVVINSTHIYFLRRLDAFRYEEIYFVCRQTQESRYLMAAVTKGKCDVDFICFNFMPRHHNIIRFRMSRPFRLLVQEKRADPDEYMFRMFREACHWNSFTLNYVDWVYEYFILDPPVPINCPIQGRFKFDQKGQKQEKYFTKQPGGVTPRPRVQVLCSTFNESDFAACLDNPKQLRLDVDRCMRLDFTGRPISEYDVSDNVLTCVGYWMEDTKSYLITYDPEDPVTEHFRCWVYKRISYNNYLMSRSMSGHCREFQVAESSTPQEGASLLLELKENELEFDGCPMNFDDGRDPYANPTVLAALGNFSPRTVLPSSIAAQLSLAVLSMLLALL